MASRRIPSQPALEVESADWPSCPSPKCHPIPKCLAWVSCNSARRRYIPFLKLVKLKVNEFWRRTGGDSMTCPSTVSDPAFDPFPCLSLHFQVELMRRVIKTAALALHRARFSVTSRDLGECGLHSVEREEPILRAVDHQHRARRDQCRKIWQVEVVIQPV